MFAWKVDLRYKFRITCLVARAMTRPSGQMFIRQSKWVTFRSHILAERMVWTHYICIHSMQVGQRLVDLDMGRPSADVLDRSGSGVARYRVMGQPLGHMFGTQCYGKAIGHMFGICTELWGSHRVTCLVY
jgi:hypothetical protein